MSDGAEPRGRATLALGLVLLAGVAWLLFFVGALGGGLAPLADSVGRPDASAPDLLAVPRGEEGAASSGPALAVRDDPAPLPDARGPVRVRVRGPGDRPVAGVQVQVVSAAVATSPIAPLLGEAGTDGQGEVLFSDLPYDGSVAVRLTHHGKGEVQLVVADDKGTWALLSKDAALPLAAVPVRGAELLLRCDVGMSLQIDVLDAATGRRIPGVRWGALPSFSLREDDFWLSTKAERMLAVAPGSACKLTVKLERVPGGRLAWDDATWSLRTHPGARRLVAQMPLRREAEIIVTFEEPRPPTEGASWSATVALGEDAPRAIGAEADALDRWHLRGVPFLPGQALRLGGTIGRWQVAGRARLPQDAREPVHVVAKCTPLPEAVPDAPRESSGSAGKTFRIARLAGTEALRLHYTLGSKFDGNLVSFLAQEIQLQNPGFTPTPGPQFRVHVQRPDGRPAPGARVTLADRTAVAGRDGVAVFADVPVSSYAALVWGAGAVFRQDVTVPPGGVGQVTVRGVPGGSVHLEVVDADGRPMPFAHLIVTQLSKQPWCDVDGDVQRLDPFTDVDGRRTLHNLEAGDLTIAARLGTRMGTIVVRVPRRGSARARIVLHDPVPATSQAPDR